MLSSVDLALAIALVVLLVVFLVYTYLRERRIKELEVSLSQRQTKAYTLGGAQVKGDIAQILGSFSTLNDYDSIMFLSSPSKQGPLDLLGVNPDSIDFIEIKKKGTTLTTAERTLKRLVDEKKVRYRILDVEIPEGVTVKERDLTNKRRGRSGQVDTATAAIDVSPTEPGVIKSPIEAP
ncbi:MAG: hypothetical protein JRN35_04825 [Nitrososphaerota archaeon]|jgi:hypothetical protein|nr:hypothetical protein [Candidatus Thermoplasmatota archaeon]MDG6912386.1 hypothetical protein [Nitrososphaerota archaeon]